MLIGTCLSFFYGRSEKKECLWKSSVCVFFFCSFNQMPVRGSGSKHTSFYVVLENKEIKYAVVCDPSIVAKSRILSNLDLKDDRMVKEYRVQVRATQVVLDTFAAIANHAVDTNSCLSTLSDREVGQLAAIATYLELEELVRTIIADT